MKVLRVVFFAAIAMAFYTTIVNAQEEANCGIHAWVIDKDPKGLNVRNQPSVSGKIIAKLARKSGDDDDIVTVYVTGYSNGWVKIARAENISGETLFDDIGWISAKMVVTGTMGNPNYTKPVSLYSQPNGKSSVGTIPSEVNVSIVGFSCGWVKVKYKAKTGWIRDANICGNPVTTCS